MPKSIDQEILNELRAIRKELQINNQLQFEASNLSDRQVNRISMIKKKPLSTLPRRKEPPDKE